MMTDAEIRRALRADRSWCLRSLSGRPLEDWRAVLAAEEARRWPRKLLVAALRARIRESSVDDGRSSDSD